MKIEEIKSIIESSEFKKNKKSIQLIELTLDLYKENRIDNTDLDGDGDMLLFQWGTYSHKENNYFYIDMTRQIVLDLEDPDEAADTMQQLSTKSMYSTDETTALIRNSNEWCTSPKNLNDFRNFIANNKAFKWAKENEPFKIDVESAFRGDTNILAHIV